MFLRVFRRHNSRLLIVGRLYGMLSHSTDGRRGVSIFGRRGRSDVTRDDRQRAEGGVRYEPNVCGLE